ncbi:MAG: hypothetical protein ACR2KC_06670, partial [Acidimicrobiales bacterium]
MRQRSRRFVPLAAVAMLAAIAPGLPASAAGHQRSPAGFMVGAADANITPPALDTPLGRALDISEFVPSCGASEAQVQAIWSGSRLFAFEKPYIDLARAGRYVPGDPYCDADGTHRYEAPYLAGGSGSNRWPLTSADPSTNSPRTTLHQPGVTPDPLQAHAVVFSVGAKRAAMVTVDSIGLFNSTMDQIRDVVVRSDRHLAPRDIFISSTHNESAPDPVGLWGPDLSGEPAALAAVGGVLPVGVTSGVDEYYMRYLVDKVGRAILSADNSVRPAQLKAAVARMPSNTQSCWSSYPFIDTDLVPVMQALSTSGRDAGRVIFSLADVGVHDETLAFSGKSDYTSMLSGDWAGRLTQGLEAQYPGSVGMEMAGLVGSVETPALYPAGTQVLRVPGALHDVAGKPVDGCRSVYADPRPPGAGALATTQRPVTDALQFVDAYAKGMLNTLVAALAAPGASTSVPSRLEAQTRSVCVQLENNLFAAAFAAGLFADRPAFADPTCTIGVSPSGSVGTGPARQPAGVRVAPPAYLSSEVGVLTVGDVQVTYSPGEVFPFTEVGGPVDAAQMPFPTDCYTPSLAAPAKAAAGNYTCGRPLAMTPDISAEMTTKFRFLAGLGEDMIGYLFPPGNFVGSQGETIEAPWALYENTVSSGHDRFGYPHSDDAESVGPHAGAA